ncbi:aquaporin SIP1-2-like isoform X1 [Chenopodium quinoa]|uniref:aquaporin SIP1-2-like isoform X1 n=1 Tax=Chenopodium quinoa TaxID=63459 RepID=UPI000B777211|nr:aquaporin SIP1-2-like isoform X1 [Chenopodium quinoa]
MAQGVGKMIKTAVGDGLMSFGWMFTASTLGIATAVVAEHFGVNEDSKLIHAIFTGIIMIHIVFCEGMTVALGGACFNPTANAAMYAAGIGDDTLLSMAVRFPAQAAGAVAGAIAISEVMPSQYKHMLGGPSIKVDLHTAAMAEGVLTFLITLAVLIIIIRIPGHMLVKTWLLAMATVTLVVAGSSYTGPSMNPANAFGWAYIRKQHNTWDQLYVYWICPFIGAIGAAWVFRIIYPLPKKQKKAPKNRKAE